MLSCLHTRKKFIPRPADPNQPFEINICHIVQNRKKNVKFKHYPQLCCEDKIWFQTICPFCCKWQAQPKDLEGHIYSKHVAFKVGDVELFSCPHCSDFQRTDFKKCYYHTITHFDTEKMLKNVHLEPYGATAGDLLPNIRAPGAQSLPQPALEDDDDSGLGGDMGGGIDDDQNGVDQPSGNSNDVNENRDVAMNDVDKDGDVVMNDHSVDNSGQSEVVSNNNEDAENEEEEEEEDPNDFQIEIAHHDSVEIEEIVQQIAPNNPLLLHEDPKLLSKIPPVYHTWEKSDPFPNKEFLRFVVTHYLTFGAKKNHINAIINDIKGDWHSPLSTVSDLPRNYDDVMAKVEKLPILNILNCTHNLPALLQRTLSMNPEFVSKLQFDAFDKPIMSEFVDTPRFKELKAKCLEGEVPLCLLLYIDSFRKFRSLFGSAYGIYCTILNAPKLENAKLENIFSIGLAKTEFDAYKTLSDVAAQLKANPVIDVKHPSGKWFKARSFIALVSADMPQRHDNCCMMSHTSNDIPCFRCKIDHSSLTSDSCCEVRSCVEWKAKLVEYIRLKQENKPENQTRIKYLYDTVGVRVECQGPSKKVFLMKSPPFFCFENLDPILHSAVDLFHVEILGLIELHFEQFVKATVGTSNLEFFQDLCRHHGFEISSRAGWNGDQWLHFCLKSPFILHEFCIDQNAHSHLKNWKMHMDYLFILLQEGMSVEDCKNALKLCKEWRNDFVALYGKAVANVPNFHAILHCIEDCLKFGPPIMYWTRNFEHKHKYFRKIIDHSNKKRVEPNTMLKDERMNVIKLMFPFSKQEFYIPSSEAKILRPGDFVTLKSMGVTRYAQVHLTKQDKVELKLFKKEYVWHPWIQGAISLDDLKVEKYIALDYDFLQGRVFETEGIEMHDGIKKRKQYFNPYSCLNFSRFKIPKL